MALIRPLEIISSMSGQVCEHSDMYFRTNRQTNKVTTGKRCYPSTKPASEAQTAVREAMKTKAKAIHSYMAAQKLSPSPEYQAIVSAYKAQHTIGSLFGFIMKHYADYEALITA